MQIPYWYYVWWYEQKISLVCVSCGTIHDTGESVKGHIIGHPEILLLWRCHIGRAVFDGPFELLVTSHIQHGGRTHHRKHIKSRFQSGTPSYFNRWNRTSIWRFAYRTVRSAWRFYPIPRRYWKKVLECLVMPSTLGHHNTIPYHRSRVPQFIIVK